VHSWLEKAWRAALGPPGGPVFLSLPEEVLLQPAPVVQERLSTRADPGVPDVSAVADALRTAKRPLIVVGGQVRRRGGTAALEALAARFQIPVAFEGGMLDGLDIAPGHPQCAGSILIGTREVEADVVLLLGTRSVSEGSPRKSAWYPNAVFVAQVNHDPVKLEGTRRVDWVSLSDPAAFAAALLAALEDTKPQIIEARRSWAARRPPGALPPGGALGRQMAGYARALAPLHDAMTRGWVVDESVMATALTVSMQTALDGRRYAGTSGASLGWGTGAAAGIALASGEPVTLIIGDGSLRFGMQGLWTIRAMNLPITIAVIDNQGYGSTRNFEREFIAKQGPAAQTQKPSYYNMDFRETGPDIAEMVRGFGIPCRRLGLDDDLRQAVLDAWAESANGPNCIILPAGFEDD
jgi:thiamine pyrophosphate-dependent acetolactate synthase large subunit-like protein